MAVATKPRTTNIRFSRTLRRRGAASINLGSNFGQGISDLTDQVLFLRDQEALEDLPNNPDKFITYAKDRTKQLGSDPDSGVWDELVSKAQLKLEEQTWQQDIKNGSKTLEEFKKFLTDRFNNAKPGSSDAHQTLLDLDAARKAIVARNENSSDQQALFSWIQSQDYEGYIKYLTNKLARTTDSRVQSVLLQQITSLRQRATQAQQVERTQARSRAIIDYQQGKIPAGRAITKLQELAQQPGITPGEVAAITSEIGSILSRERSGAGSAQDRELSTDLLRNEREWAGARQDILNSIAKGKPVSDAQWSRLNNATDVLTVTYNNIADKYAAEGNSTSAKSWTDKAELTLPGENQKLVYAVDQNVTKKADITLGDQGTFLTGISGLSPQQQIAKIAERVRRLTTLAEGMKSDQARTEVQDAISRLQNGADKVINTASTRPLTQTPDQDAELSHLFREYETKFGTLDTLAAKPLSESAWRDELKYANDSASFSLNTGFMKPDAYSPDEFKHLKGLLTPVDNRTQEASQLAQTFGFLSNATPSALTDTVAPIEGSPEATAASMRGEPGAATQPAAQPTSQSPGRPPGLSSILGEDMGAEMGPPATDLPVRTVQDTTQEAPVDMLAQQGDRQQLPSRTLNDSLQTALDFLDAGTPIDIPDFQVPELPDFDPFVSTLTDEPTKPSLNSRPF